MHILSKIKHLWGQSWLPRWVERYNNEKYRKRLQNDNFSILCSSCIGGVIYHKLGKQFLSPTINLFMSNADFVSFCLHLDVYLAQSLVFVRTDRPYPVGVLPGNSAAKPVTLFFNHAKAAEDARRDWDKRKQRINRDNLFLIMYNLDGVNPETIRQLEQVPCRNKVILTADPIPEIPWSLQIKPTAHRANNYTYMDKDILGRAAFEKHFDFVSWLNTKNTVSGMNL